MLYFFFLYQSISSSLYTAFDAISSKIDKVISIDPSANAFVFGEFNIHHKDLLLILATYSGGNDRHGELYCNLT